MPITVKYRQKTAFLLFALILFQSFGWHLVWLAMHSRAKMEASVLMFEPGTAIKEIVLSCVTYQNSKVGNREVSIAGNLYDVREAVVLGDSIRLTLYHDWHEQMLFAVLGAYFSAEGASDSPCANALAILLVQYAVSAFIVPVKPHIVSRIIIPQKQAFHWQFYFPYNILSAPFIPPRSA